MRIRVHMLAFGEKDQIRNVKVSDLTHPESILDQTFYCGQNEFADDEDLEQNLPSVSYGDVIEYPEGQFHLIKGIGFTKLNSYQFTLYKNQMSQDERELIAHFIALGDIE